MTIAYALALAASSRSSRRCPRTRGNGGPGARVWVRIAKRPPRSAGISTATRTEEAQKRTRRQRRRRRLRRPRGQRRRWNASWRCASALEEARARAILEPNAENVKAYLHLQKEALQRAASFSDAFRRTVWASPDLDYTLKRPVGALAKKLWSDERRAERAAVLARLGERYGLIYLGNAKCPGCRVFGPLLRAFALRHGLDVLAVSLTGEPLEGWPEAVPDQGRAARLGLNVSRRCPRRLSLRHANRKCVAGLLRRGCRGPARRAHLRPHRTGDWT